MRQRVGIKCLLFDITGSLQAHKRATKWEIQSLLLIIEH